MCKIACFVGISYFRIDFRNVFTHICWEFFTASCTKMAKSMAFSGPKFRSNIMSLHVKNTHDIVYNLTINIS